MSGLVYPSNLPGLSFDSVRTPMFKTGLQEAVSGKESRASYMAYPTFQFDLQYEFLQNNVAVSQLKQLAGLFAQMRGRFDTFLYTDPTYNAVVDEPFGVGDGVTTQFQLTATFQNAGGPGWPELIQNLNGAAVIKKATVVQAQPGACSIGATGIVTFVSAPAAAAALTWTGSFYYRCRFLEDKLPLQQFMFDFWKSRTVSLKSIKL